MNRWIGYHRFGETTGKKSIFRPTMVFPKAVAFFYGLELPIGAFSFSPPAPRRARGGQLTLE
jgi:hypothetical protein